MYCVYVIINLINNKSYVGKSKDPITRWNSHKNIARKNGSRRAYIIHRAIKKYGLDNFEFVILEKFDTNEKANEAERFWIQYLQTKNPNGYNIQDGGEGGKTKGMTGKHHSLETRQKMSQANSGANSPNWGKRYKGRPCSEAAKVAARQANLGRPPPNKIPDLIRETIRQDFRPVAIVASDFGISKSSVYKIQKEADIITQERICSKRKTQDRREQSKNYRIDWPSDEVLSKMVYEKPMIYLAKDLGVSDVAIRKKCIKRGIDIPSKGFWLKEANKYYDNNKSL